LRFGFKKEDAVNAIRITINSLLMGDVLKCMVEDNSFDVA
jgi:hypothetical protein